MVEIICPYCRKEINDEDALLCHFCGNSLRRSSGELLGMMRGAGMKWAWLCAGVAVLMVMMAVFLQKGY